MGENTEHKAWGTEQIFGNNPIVWLLLGFCNGFVWGIAFDSWLSIKS